MNPADNKNRILIEQVRRAISSYEAGRPHKTAMRLQMIAKSKRDALKIENGVFENVSHETTSVKD